MKSISSNPLAGFLAQIGGRAVLEIGLRDWGKPLEPRGLINSERASDPNLLCWMPESMPMIEWRPAKVGMPITATQSGGLCLGETLATTLCLASCETRRKLLRAGQSWSA